MIQLTLNVKTSKIIKIISFYSNFERELNLFTLKKSYILANAALNRIKTLKNLRNNISKIHHRLTKYINKK